MTGRSARVVGAVVWLWRECGFVCGSGVSCRVVFQVFVFCLEGWVMSRKSCVVVWADSDLEVVLEGLSNQADGVQSLVCGGSLPGDVPKWAALLVRLHRLQAEAVQAYVQGAPVVAERVPRRPRSCHWAALESPAASPAAAVPSSAAVDPVRVVSAVEVAVPAGVWQALRECVSEAEGVIRSALAFPPVDQCWARQWLVAVEKLREKWVLSPPVVSAAGDGGDGEPHWCPGCGVRFVRAPDGVAGCLCPACESAAPAGDQA